MSDHRLILVSLSLEKVTHDADFRSPNLFSEYDFLSSAVDWAALNEEIAGME